MTVTTLTTLETANDVVAADIPECIRDWCVNTLTVDSIDDEVIRVWTPFTRHRSPFKVLVQAPNTLALLPLLFFA
jgi:hypothetical protein